MLVFTLGLFVAAIMLIGKVVVSRRKKNSQLIAGSARWRTGNSSSANGAERGAAGGGQTRAAYAPMDATELRSNFDNPQDNRLDWERQFFDDTEPSEPQQPSRLRLEVREEDEDDW